MHPDQRTPETHRYRSADSNPAEASGGSADDTGALEPRRPEQDQRSDAVDRAVAHASDEPASAPDVEDGARVAEAGHAYTGRGVADKLKANPRVEEPGAGTADDAA